MGKSSRVLRLRSLLRSATGLCVAGLCVAGLTAGAARAEEVVTSRGPAVLRAASAALVLSGQEGGGVPVDVLLLARPEGAVVLVAVGGDVVAENVAAGPVALEVFVYVLGPEGEVRDQVSRRVDLAGEAHRVALQDGDLHLALPVNGTGGHEVRVLARLGEKAFGLRHAAVAEAPPAVLRPSGLRVVDPPADRQGKAWDAVASWAASAGPEAPVWPPEKTPPSVAMRAPPEEALEALASENASRARRPELMADYLRVLAQLGGEDDAALRALYAFEGRVVGRRVEPPAVERLTRIEGVTAGELLRGGQQHAAQAAPQRRRMTPQALLPIALLHADAADGYRSADRFRMASLSEDVVLSLVDFMLEEARAADGAAPEASALHRSAARLLAGLAGRMLERGLVSRAEAILRRALEYDGDEPGTLLALAAIDDRRGRTAAALRHLERLAAVEPDNPEAELLRAVCLLRQGEVEDGLILLENRCQGGDWTALVACQERSRRAALEGRWEEALAYVEASLRRWPGHPALGVQRAYVLDRLGRGREALEQLHDIDRGSVEETGERARFNDWPLKGIEEGYAAVREEVAGLLPALGRAVTALRREVEE